MIAPPLPLLPHVPESHQDTHIHTHTLHFVLPFDWEGLAVSHRLREVTTGIVLSMVLARAAGSHLTSLGSSTGDGVGAEPSS